MGGEWPLYYPLPPAPLRDPAFSLLAQAAASGAGLKVLLPGAPLGRSHGAVEQRLKVKDAAWEPAGGFTCGRNGKKMNWRNIVARAMDALPERRGTVQDIFSKVEALPGLILVDTGRPRPVA